MFLIVNEGVISLQLYGDLRFQTDVVVSDISRIGGIIIFRKFDSRIEEELLFKTRAFFSASVFCWNFFSY